MSADVPTASAAPPSTTPARSPRRSCPEACWAGPAARVATVIMLVLSLVWLFPLIWAVVNSLPRLRLHPAQRLPLLRRLDDRQLQRGLGARQLRAVLPQLALITVPAVILTLLLASMVAFVLARFSFRFNLALLGFFLAANLLPPQALLIPVFRMFREIPLPMFMSDSGLMLNSFWASDPGQHRLPAGLLHVRPQQLHEDDPARDLRVRRARRGQRVAAVLAADDAAGAAGARGARHPRRSPGSTTSSSGRPC